METVTVILPAYNEERRLRESVRVLSAALGPMFPDYEIIISEDGSSDRTAEIAGELCSERVRLIRNGKRMGKGGAIMKAAQAARGDIIVFMDVDLASNIGRLKELVGSVRSGSAIAIGSRYLPGSKSRRSAVRDIASRCFNWLVRASLGSSVTDHQCGFKCFRKSQVLDLMREIENKDWFWDTELLVRAQRMGLKVSEVPIEWREAPGSRFRLVEDTAHMAYSLFFFKLRHG